MEYFKHYPHVEYCKQNAINILARNKVRDYLKNNTYLYEEHIIKEYERPDIIANDYYGNFKYTWLIFYANDIFDPIRDWVLSDKEFYRFLNHKYIENNWLYGHNYAIGDLIQYNSVLYQCIENHTSGMPINGLRLSDVQFFRLENLWEVDSLIDEYAFFYYRSDRDSGEWLKIIGNNGITLTVDGILPVGCDVIEVYDPSKWLIYNEGALRPGFQIAHQTIHEFRDSHDLVVDFNSWYEDVFEDILSTANAQNPPYDFIEHAELAQQGQLHTEYNENIIQENEGRMYMDSQMVDTQIAHCYSDNYGHEYWIKIRVDFSVIPARVYFTEQDIILDGNFDPNTVVNFDVPIGQKYMITNFEYEQNLNEDRRKIKLLNKAYAPQLLIEFKNLFNV